MGNTQDARANILITGAGGFIGQALASALLNDQSIAKISLTDISTPKTPNTANTTSSISIESFAADFTSPQTCEQIIKTELTHIYLLHGIMSGQAEADLELGLRVNVDSMRYITDVIRKQNRSNPIRIIFPSSLAVFGPAKDGEVVTEKTMPLPQSSYGAEKSIVETLLNDFSRRGLLDARIVRLPTIIVRPGRPTGAASSFFSGIIREPLNGETGVLPVKRDLKAWVCSARTVIRNLVAAKDIPEERFLGESRIVNLPGKTVTVQQMLDGLLDVGGQKAINLVKEEFDEKVAKIVGSWPAEFDTMRAKKLGFRDDVPLEQAFRDYIEDYM
ncbi:D-erythronate dehydrogenase [Pseudocercospora fuligena]|uniref:D-erythronate dehydrogenase n=1 Tax=Pseudocercospora fuligena TaxID=685502 RepID=A0A8H6VQN8_9PEZI|nr:D-erythronate dehydrogenase [Pseudocercospora fuligena]